MAQALNSQPLTTVAQIQSQASAHVIYDGQSGTGTGFSQGMSVSFHKHSMLIHSAATDAI